ncbi:MAG: polymerase ECF-type sigma factor [Myxococcaceae bacterium]|jgi:RNA polymerase sigma factor (sigma-70 family)|nr:polymerase ECF-type sigma factor [Myxococcaceae bacterium]
MLRAVLPQDGELELEKKLVARAQAGDRQATGELLHKYGPGLYRSVLLPRLGSEAAAKDALAETYAKVVERIGRFTWQNVGFYPWLRTVALRVALDHLRARKRMLLWDAEDVEREVDAAATTTPIDQALSDRRDREAARTKVEDALGKIHPRYARVIRLRVLEERPREDVAAELEVTPATFDVLLHRAVAALKKALGDTPSETKSAATKTEDASPEGSRMKTRTGKPTKREKLDDA